jgi:hypothetical protein
MVTYFTKSDLVNNLSRQFNRTVDTTDVKVKLYNNTPTSITINGTVIHQYEGVWCYNGKQFNYKKSAVGYAISCINKDNITAKQILDLDNRISKLSEDCVHYRHSMRYANRVRKNILSCRLSEDTARLEYTKSQLHSNLLSINLT